jgi:hypothetical protein
VIKFLYFALNNNNENWVSVVLFLSYKGQIKVLKLSVTEIDEGPREEVELEFSPAPALAFSPTFPRHFLEQ